MGENVVAMILHGAGREPIPLAAEQLHLARLIQQGLRPDASSGQKRAGLRARQRLVSGNIRLAVSVARHFLPRLGRNSSLDLADLIQEAVIGLDTAARRFDPERGCSFSTYAMWWCRQAVHRLIQNQLRTIRLPAQVLELERRWIFRPPDQDVEAFCRQWNVTAERLQFCLASVERSNVRSLDAPTRTEEGEGLGLLDRLNCGSVDPLDALNARLLLDLLQAMWPQELALLERQVLQSTSTSTLAAEQGVSSTAMGRRLKKARRRLVQALGTSAAPSADGELDHLR